MAVTAESQLVGREDEVDRLRRLVGGLSDGPRAALIRGDAGVGKTAVWRAAIGEAKAAGLVVLTTRPEASELPMGLAGLGDLLDAALPQGEEYLATSQRITLRVAAGLEPPRGAPADAIALPRAFAALLRGLAQRAPVLVAVDDVQWLDPPSRRILGFVARRLGDARVGFLTTQRGDGSDPLELERALEERFDEIVVSGLTLGALAHLVRARLDIRVPRPILARVHAVSGGNPMFALEFARSFARDQSQLGPIPIPESLEELVRERIAQYPDEIQALLAVVAAAERPPASLLERVDASSLVLLDLALDAGALTLGPDGRVGLPHPLLAAAAYGSLAAGERRALHARIAEASADVEERARHLALSSVQPDASVAELLDEAAKRARARGAPDAAAELAEAAARLTPEAEPDRRAERRLAAAEHLADAGRHAESKARLERLLDSGVTGPTRARALLLSMMVEHDAEVVVRRLEEALEHVGDDRRVRAHVLLTVSVEKLYRGEVTVSERMAREAAAIAEEVDDKQLLATALAATARRASLLGRPEPELLERALVLAEEYGTVRGWPTPRRILGAELGLRRGDLERARTFLEAELDAIGREGRENDRAPVLLTLAGVEWHAGRWQRMEHHLDQVAEIVDEGDQAAELAALLVSAWLAAGRGDVESARHLVSQARSRCETLHAPPVDDLLARSALGFLELSLDAPARAWDALEDVVRTWRRVGLVADERDMWANAIEALVALDRLADAEALLSELDAEAEKGHRWAAAAALRCRALLDLARGDADQARSAAEQAAREFQEAGFLLDGGRALLVAGEALRRMGERRRAGEKLEAAKAVFAGLGARLWHERAERELRRAQPRPRRDGDLTSAERRVAALVAAGGTNREVAAQLFTTVATVEAHLTRIYRKAGVRSRTELARRVAEGAVTVADDP